jgi:hypothetical protein
MFSKPMRILEHDVIENRVVQPRQNSRVVRKEKDRAILDKCKQTDLKEVLRNYKSEIAFRQNDDRGYKRYNAKELRKIKLLYDFALSGSKQVLMDRVSRLYIMEEKCLLIQKCFRGYIIRESFRLRGPALKKRGMCVNDTDFYTLEPIKNISVNEFFSYEGDKKFVYGFDIDSITTLFKNKQRTNGIVNPYNRESMDYMRITIEKLTRLNRLINKSSTSDYIQEPQRPVSQRMVYSVTDLSGNVLRDQNAAIDQIYDINEMIEKLRTIRNLPTQRRIENLFVEIDSLGNYAQSTWFAQLDRRDCIRYFRSLYDIWYYRAQIPFDVKRKICPLSDPFITILNQRIRYNDVSEEVIRELCLCVMEDMIYTGIDNGFRTLGAFHVLCGLTLVSSDARTAMPWLYDSVVY